LINLANKLEEFHVMVDSLQGLNGLLATPLNEGKQWSVFLEVDCGNGRSKLQNFLLRLKAHYALKML
jgi:D-serine deaminase-like pyridoxal phosphate-dependent protein